MTELEEILVTERELVKFYINQLKQNEITKDDFISTVELMLKNTASFGVYKDNVIK